MVEYSFGMGVVISSILTRGSNRKANAMEEFEQFKRFDNMVRDYINESDEENCVILVNGHRFRQRGNVVVFDNPRQALKILKNSMWRYRTVALDKMLDKWIAERVTFVPPEYYYRFKRKLRE